MAGFQQTQMSCLGQMYVVRYYRVVWNMASSTSGQDESNPAVWLATRAGKVKLSFPLETTGRVPQEKLPQKPYYKSFIDQACSVKIAEYLPRSLFDSISVHKLVKENLANIQPSWPHTWSITHIYCTYTSLWVESSATFPESISGAVHLIGIQPCKYKKHEACRLTLECFIWNLV